MKIEEKLLTDVFGMINLNINLNKPVLRYYYIPRVRKAP